MDQLLLPDCNFQHCDLNVEKTFEVSTFFYHVACMKLISLKENGPFLCNTNRHKVIMNINEFSFIVKEA